MFQVEATKGGSVNLEDLAEEKEEVEEEAVEWGLVDLEDLADLADSEAAAGTPDSEVDSEVEAEVEAQVIIEEQV